MIVGILLSVVGDRRYSDTSQTDRTLGSVAQQRRRPAVGGKVVKRSLQKTAPLFLLPAAVALVLMALSVSVEPAPAQTSQGYWQVAEIRFGIIEPPVVAQRDITVRAPKSNQQPEPKPLECSGMAWHEGQLIISSDRHGHLLFTCPIDLASMKIGTPVPYVVIQNEENLLDDAEALTVRTQPDGSARVYVLCSLSNDRSERPLPKRRHMLRLRLAPGKNFAVEQPLVLNASKIRTETNKHFNAVGIEPYRTFYGDFPAENKNTYRWGNVEGISFTPTDPTLLLCGMRNPLVSGMAPMLVVRGVDAAFQTEDPDMLQLVDLFTIDLGLRGVSDVCWDPLTKGYLVSAAKSNGPKLDKDQPFPPNTLDSALFWWSGRKNEMPILFARVPDMKIEAICRLGSSPFIAICSDEGDVSEGREDRQSILTILYFTGIATRS